MNKRNTIQRSLVLETVQELRCHTTADEIFNTIVKKYPNVGRGTVYRNLNLLADIGEIRKVEMPNGAESFDHECHEHYHARCVKCGIDFESWVKHYNSEETKDGVESDFLLVKQYNIQGVPALVINGKQQISGAQPLSKIIQVIEGIEKDKEQPSTESASCRLVDGKIECE